MPTPCQTRCRLDDAGRICRDCGRTVREIAIWGSLDFDEQARIMARLPERLADMRIDDRRRHQAAQQQQQ
jgi:predicted Fe-S protein YdhL (DUF1289 family)